MLKVRIYQRCYRVVRFRNFLHHLLPSDEARGKRCHNCDQLPHTCLIFVDYHDTASHDTLQTPLLPQGIHDENQRQESRGSLMCHNSHLHLLHIAVSIYAWLDGLDPVRTCQARKSLDDRCGRCELFENARFWSHPIPLLHPSFLPLGKFLEKKADNVWLRRL